MRVSGAARLLPGSSRPGAAAEVAAMEDAPLLRRGGLPGVNGRCQTAHPALPGVPCCCVLLLWPDPPCLAAYKPACGVAASQPRRADGAFAELLPWLLEQAQDWEVAATASCVGDAPLVRVSAVAAGFCADRGGAQAAPMVLVLRGT